MRLLVDGRYLQDHFPGVGRYVYGLVRSLAQLGGSDLELWLVVDPAAQNTRFDLRGLFAGGRVRPIEGPPVFHPAAPAALARLERRLRPDVAHYTHYFRPWVRGAPSVVTIHDLIPLQLPESMPSRIGRLAYRVLVWLAIRFSDVVIVPSAATAGALAGYFPALKPAVVPEGVGPEFRPLPGGEIENFRRGKALPARFCLYHGSNKPHKNLASLLTAFSLVADLTVSLVISGHVDPRLPRPTPRGLGSDRVRWLGPVSDADLVGLLNAADVFVYPTLAEGFGLPVLEAMACGRPVVTSAGTAPAEVAGDAAILVNPRDPAEVARAVSRVLADRDLAEKLGRKALVRAAEFSWERAAARTLEVYLRAARRVSLKGD